MRTEAVVGSLIAGALVLSSPSARADEESERLEALERRVEEIEEGTSRREQVARAVENWSRYVRLSGSSDVGFFGGQENSLFDPDSFMAWDARFFVDAQLGNEVSLADHTVFRNVAFTFEWNLVRLGRLNNNVGELYIDFQNFGGWGGLSMQAGRFQIPVGEAYLLYSQGYAKRAFVSNPVGGPWWWDEGLRFYGSFSSGRFGYVASVSDGDTSFNSDSTGDKQLTLRLYAHLTPWLYLSVSGLRTGKLGNASSPASGALWLGEAWARAFGSSTAVDNYQDGAIVPDAPNVIDDTYFVGADAIVELEDKLRIWLAYGRYSILGSDAFYDRALQYWIAEVVLQGAWLSEVLRPFYLGGRANGLGTYDDNRGYLLDVRRGDSLGYNMASINEYSVVLGWKMLSFLRMRLEYTHSDIAVVRGVPASIRDAARNADRYAIEFGASF